MKEIKASPTVPVHSTATEQFSKGDHYAQMELEPNYVMYKTFTPEEFKGYLKGQVLKYIMRADRKDNSEDYKKSRYYSELLAAFTSGEADEFFEKY